MEKSFQQQYAEERAEVSRIKQLLEGVDPKHIMYAIREMGQVFVPQCYFDEHAKEYGFKDVNDMREGLNEEYYLYSEIDNMVANLSIDVLSDREDC